MFAMGDPSCGSFQKERGLYWFFAGKAKTRLGGSSGTEYHLGPQALAPICLGTVRTLNLLKALTQVSGMTLLSRILGFARDAVIARAFGAGSVTDAFFVAFRIPNLLRRMFAEGAFSQAFVPVLAEYKNKRGHEATRDLVDRVATLLALVLMGITLLGVLAAPAIVYLTAPGFSASPEKFALTVELLRITFPYIFFISLVALAGGVLNTYSKFWVPAFTPVLLNVAFIIFVVWFASRFHPPVRTLAWGAFCGGAVQLLFQLPFLQRIGLLPRFRWAWRDEGVRRILRIMGPAIFGVSIGQISLLISTIFASGLRDGSVSWLFYADRLMEFPTGLLGVALGTILLPSLSKYYHASAQQEYSRLLDWGLRLTFLLTLPAAVALALLAVPLIATLFHYGKFSVDDVWMTRQALMAYSLGLMGLIVVKILAPGFYARQNIKTPVKIGLVTLAATQAMNLVFVFALPLQHAGLALATGLGACVNAGLLFFKLRERDIYQPQAGWVRFMSRITVALIVLAAVLWWAGGDAERWFVLRGYARVRELGWIVIIGMTSYFAALWLTGMRLQDFKRGSPD
jgi:putative peptidoglycan lipid II flippase